MTEQTQQGASQPSGTPERIALDDFIEAVSRGVTRALQAEEVSGYLQSTDPLFPGQVRGWPGGITVGLIYNPPPIFPGPASSGTAAR